MESVESYQDLHNTHDFHYLPHAQHPERNGQSIEASKHPTGKSRANHWHTRTIHRKTLHYSHGRERSPIQPARPKITNLHQHTPIYKPPTTVESQPATTIKNHQPLVWPTRDCEYKRAIQIRTQTDTYRDK